MCGIAGFYGTFSNAKAKLTLANERQLHRGPDASGLWFNSTSEIGLAHRRLSILDLSASGNQPMLFENSADKSEVVLVFNGEIYNYRQLRKELEEKGYSFQSSSDTEVLLKLYLAEGEAMLHRLNGIFAFAIWDSRCDFLFIARDALGVKPLYFGENASGFVFASEIKALMPFLDSTLNLSASALHRYLSFLWCPGNETPLEGVYKLAPGEALTVKLGKIAQRKIWYQLPVFRLSIPFGSQITARRQVSEPVSIDKLCDRVSERSQHSRVLNGERYKAHLTLKDAITGTQNALKTAVKRQLVADVPVGAFLSGGLDSSAIVALARESTPNIRCFTIEGGQELGMADDLPYARRVAKYLNVPLDVVEITSSRMADDVYSMIAQLDEPLADPAALNVLYISRLAREQGIKVLLSGAGGDDLFTGYRRHVAVYYQRYWERYWQCLPLSLRLLMQNATVKMNQNNPFYRRLTKWLSGANLTGDARLADYFVWSKEALLFSLYTPEFKAQVGIETACLPLINFLKPLPHSVSPLERMLALEQRFFLADHNLNYTDKMSMAAGVEVRVPFLDLELVDYAARIPIELKQKGKVGKWILKKSMEAYLPKDIIYRPKSGFSAPLRNWMKGDLRPLIQDLLSIDSLKKRGLFDPSAVQKIIAQNDKGQIDGAYLLFSLLSIEIWCRTYFDVAPISQAEKKPLNLAS